MSEVKNNESKSVSDNVVEKILDLTVNPQLLTSTNSTVEETAEKAKDVTEAVGEESTEKAETTVEETTEKAETTVEETTEKAKDVTEDVVEETTEKAETTVEESAEKAKDATETVVEETPEKAEAVSVAIAESVVEETTEKAEAVSVAVAESVVEETTEKAEAVVEAVAEAVVEEKAGEIKLNIVKVKEQTEDQVKIVEKAQEITTNKVKEVSNTINVKSFKNNDVTKNLEVSDKIYHLVKDNIRGFDFDNTNVVILVTKVMTITGKVSTLTGMEKKNLVLSICERILDEDTTIDKEEQKFIHLTLHSLVDLMVDVSKGKLKLNNKLSNKKKAFVPRLPPGQIIDSVIDKLKTIIKNRKYSCQEIIVNLSIITGMVMTIIEQYPYLSGIEKKNIVIQVLKRLIKKELPNIVNVSDENQVMINLSLETLPNIIDTLIGVSSGKVKVNEQTVATGCLALFSCLKNKNSKNRNSKNKKVEKADTSPVEPIVEATVEATTPVENTEENTEENVVEKSSENVVSEVKNVDEVEVIVDGTLTEKKKTVLDKTDGLVVDRLNEALDNNPYSKDNIKTLKENDSHDENQSKLSVV